MRTYSTMEAAYRTGWEPMPRMRVQTGNALLGKIMIRIMQTVLLFAIMFATMNAIFGAIDQQVCSQVGAMQNVALHCEEVIK